MDITIKKKGSGFEGRTAWGCGTGVCGSDRRKEEMHSKAHPKQVVSSEDELTSSVDDSLNI